MVEPKIAVIIPTFNEELAIQKVIRDIPPIVNRIIVVDGGSTDQTVKFAREAGAEVFSEHRHGYGLACLRGIQEVKTEDIIVFLDGDYSDYPNQLNSLIEPIISDKADLVLGSRVLGKRESGAMLFHAFMANILFSAILRFFCRIDVTDIGPFRAIRTKELNSLGMQEPDYGWTLEMMIKAARKGLRVLEAPVDYRKRIGKSKVSGSLKASLLAGYRMMLTMRYIWN